MRRLEVVAVLVAGADATLDIQKAILHFEAHEWSAFGHNLNELAELLSRSKCNSVACKVVEGLLNKAGVTFENLETCEKELRLSIQGIMAGAKLFEDHSYKSAIKTWSGALSDIQASAAACGISKDLLDETGITQLRQHHRG